jgi:hypothetical protein
LAMFVLLHHVSSIQLATIFSSTSSCDLSISSSTPCASYNTIHNGFPFTI